MEYIRTEVINDKYADEENSDVLSEFQGSVLWTKRSLVYRLSFLTLLLLFALFLLGFSSPFWMTKLQVTKYRGYYNIQEKVDVSIGLWRVCEGTSFSDIADCTDIPDSTHYILVCQALLCLCLIFTVFSLIFGMYENCATRYDVDEGSEVRTKRPEINAVIGGIFGMAGIAMYGTSIVNAMISGEGGVHWAFLITAASVTGMIVCGVLMAITNPIHSATHNFPGETMSLSRQNSLKICEPSIQNRLVHSGDSMAQFSGSQASGTTYGGTGSSYDIKDVQFLQRSQSCLSSQKTSMDISPTFGGDRSDSQTSTYTVETHDIHTRAHDSSTKPEIKLYNKAVYKKSWHFDDRNAEDDIADLMSNPSGDVLLTEVRTLNKTDDVKSLVSSWRDTLKSAENPKITLIGQTQGSLPNETADLMVLDDPLEETSAEQKSRIKIKTKEARVARRKANTSKEEIIVAPSQIFSDLQRSTTSAGSWENQPWPDPPTENETQEPPIQLVAINKSSGSDSLPSAKSTEPKLKHIPESHQFQSHSKKHTQCDDTNISYKSLKSNDFNVKSVKGNQSKDDRTLISGKSVLLYKTIVPVRKEYDNPLFKSQPQDRERAHNFSTVSTVGDNFSGEICDSTATVLPSRGKPSLPNYYAATITMQCEPISHRTSSHSAGCSRSEDSGFTLENSIHLSNGQISGMLPPTYSKFGQKTTQNISKKNLEVKYNSKSRHTKSKETKSRSRKVMRGQQAESGQLDSELMRQQNPPSPASERKERSPQLAIKLPKFGSNKRELAGTREGLEYDHGVP